MILLILFAVLLVSGIRMYVFLSTNHNIVEEQKKEEDAFPGAPYEAIIVLGAGVWRDRTPSPMLANRLDKAIELYKSGVSDRIIVTGDHRPGEYDEVDVMWEYLVERNIPEEKIERDYKGFSTYESMYRAANTYHVKRAVIVTQKYHLYRTLYIGQRYGMELRGVEAENAGSTSGIAYREVREWAATVKDLWLCIIGKEIAE